MDYTARYPELAVLSRLPAGTVVVGPDGAVYVADLYQEIIQHNQINFRDPRRDHTPDLVDRSQGSASHQR